MKVACLVSAALPTAALGSSWFAKPTVDWQKKKEARDERKLRKFMSDKLRSMAQCERMPRMARMLRRKKCEEYSRVKAAGEQFREEATAIRNDLFSAVSSDDKQAFHKMANELDGFLASTPQDASDTDAAAIKKLLAEGVALAKRVVAAHPHVFARIDNLAQKATETFLHPVMDEFMRTYYQNENVDRTLSKKFQAVFDGLASAEGHSLADLLNSLEAKVGEMTTSDLNDAVSLMKALRDDPRMKDALAEDGAGTSFVQGGAIGDCAKSVGSFVVAALGPVATLGAVGLYIAASYIFVGAGFVLTLPSRLRSLYKHLPIYLVPLGLLADIVLLIPFFIFAPVVAFPSFFPWRTYDDDEEDHPFHVQGVFGGRPMYWMEDRDVEDRFCWGGPGAVWGLLTCQ